MSTNRFAPTSPYAVASLIAAPVLLLASALIQPALKSDERAQLQVILTHHDRYFWFTMLVLFGTMLLVPAFHALGRAPADPSRTTRVGSALAVFGALIGTGDAMTQFVFLQMASPARDLGQMAPVVKAFDSANGPAQLFLASGLAFVAGGITLAVGLHRDGVAPGWVCAMFAVGIVANMAGFIVQSIPLLIVSSAVLVVSMGALGLGLLRSTAVTSGVRTGQRVAVSQS